MLLLLKCLQPNSSDPGANDRLTRETAEGAAEQSSSGLPGTVFPRQDTGCLPLTSKGL